MTKRIQRLNQLIKKEIGQMFLRELDFPSDVLITVTRVETSANLIDSSVWISVLPENKEKDVLGFLTRRIYFFQQKLNERLEMRPVPKIKFLEEELTGEAGQIEEVLERLKNTAT